MQRVFWSFLVVWLISSCVPNKRIVYFQNSTEPKFGKVNNADTSSRVYNTYYHEYVFQPLDIISLNIATITPQEFDFVKKYEEQLGLIRKLNQYQLGGGGGGGGGGGIRGGGGGVGISAIALDAMNTGFVLDAEGYLELPYIGMLKFAGLTITQCEDMVREKLKGYFETPVIRIQLLNFHFTILGEVNTEGRYTTYDPNATIIDAFTFASNLTDYADRSQVKIIRTEGGQAKVHYVNTLNEDLLGQPGYYIHPNDIIIVPPLRVRQTKKYTLPTYTTAISLISTSITFLLFIVTLSNR